MFDQAFSRRNFLKTASCGFGYMAFAGMSTQQAAAEYQNPLAPKAPHFTPRAKRIIFLCMRGGPTHVDTFDYKPALYRDDGKSVSVSGLERGNGRRLLRSPWKFNHCGQSGLPISEL